jgi:hypothetical protein
LCLHTVVVSKIRRATWAGIDFFDRTNNVPYDAEKEFTGIFYQMLLQQDGISIARSFRKVQHCTTKEDILWVKT